jgi:hypothetical protein
MRAVFGVAKQNGSHIMEGVQLKIITRRTLAIEALQRKQEARELRRFLENKNKRELDSARTSIATPKRDQSN